MTKPRPAPEPSALHDPDDDPDSLAGDPVDTDLDLPKAPVVAATSRPAS